MSFLQVPYFRPDVGGAEVEAVSRVLRSGWLTSGPVAKEFERQFAEAMGASHAIAVNSCTSGLHAALLASGVRQNDEVITTPFTFASTIRAIEDAGAKPVFVDIAADLNIDAAMITPAITERTRAILPVHIAGLPCDVNALHVHQLPVIEDAAHAFGAAWRGGPVGSSDFSTAVFSFYANKNLTSGEGGMVTTSDADMAERLRHITGLGIERGGPNHDSRWQYEVVEQGFKYNLSDVLAAIGLAQLAKSADHAARREVIASFYMTALSGLEEIELPRTPAHVTHAWHLFVIRLNLDQLTVDRDAFIDLLAERGLGCSVHFKPVPLHRYFAHYGSMDRWPVAQREYPRLISLPIYPGLTEAELAHVAAQVLDVVTHARKHVFALS